MVVGKCGAAYTVVADEGGEAGEGDFEAQGFGGLGGEEAGLDAGTGARVGVEGDGEDRGGGGVGLEVELEEFEEEVAVVEGEGGF